MLSWVESCLLDAYRDQVPPIERKILDAECVRVFECIQNQDNDDLLYGVLGCCELAVEEVLSYACPKFKVHAFHVLIPYETLHVVFRFSWHREGAYLQKLLV